MSGRVNVQVRSMAPDDWLAVREIYTAGIATGIATFETDPPAWDRWNAAHRADLRHVAIGDGGTVVGWVAATQVSARLVYAGVVEHSVYVHPDLRGRGVGRVLLETLLAEADTVGVWTVQTGIFPENVASVELHVRCGFRIVGLRGRIGRLAGVWRDTLLLERRSPHVGIANDRRPDPSDAGTDR